MNDIKQITQEVEQKKQAATPKTNGSKPSVKSEVKENYKKAEETRPQSPMLDQTTKEKLINLGKSLDSKQFTDAIGFIDLRMLLKWFAKAISRHLDFSRGYLFLEDMKKSATLRKEGLKFTYNLHKNMKIDMKRLKDKANQIDSKKESPDGELGILCKLPV